MNFLGYYLCAKSLCEKIRPHLGLRSLTQCALKNQKYLLLQCKFLLFPSSNLSNDILNLSKPSYFSPISFCMIDS